MQLLVYTLHSFICAAHYVGNLFEGAVVIKSWKWSVDEKKWLYMGEYAMHLKVFAIELTNVCNAKCTFCPYPTPAHTREKGFMQIETLMRLFEVVEVGGVNLSGLGEPLLHPRRHAFIKLMVDRGFKVQINTNGSRLDQEEYERLLDVGVNNIVITADYFKWNRDAIIEDKACPVTMLTITREPDHPEMGQVRKPLDDWGGQIGKVDRPKVRCSYLYGSFVDICWDGTIKRCHVDFNANHAMGNIHTWTGDRMYYGEGIPLCSGCSGYRFTDGIVSGNYDGDGQNLVQLTTP